MNIEKFEIEQTMTLKEITDLLEVRHNDAMAVVSKMLENQEFGHATKISYRTSRGNEYETYQLNKRQSIAVAAKLNTSLLMRIIDRWQELEARDSKPLLPQNYEEALEHLLVQVKENKLLIEENKQLETNLADTQAVVDEYEDRLPDEWERNLRQVAKLIEVKPNKFNQCLMDYGYIYKNRGIYYGRKYYVERGWFKTKHFSDNYGNFKDSFVVTNIGYKGLTRHIAQGKINIENIRTNRGE